MKKTILFILTLSGIYGFGQELDCKDFTSGTFVVNVEEPIPVEWKIIRDGNTQKEIIEELPEQLKGTDYPTTQYANIEWIDACSYRLTYDDSKIALTETQKYINQVGGVLAEVIKIEGNCFFYKSTMSVEGKELRIDGKMCRE